MSRRTANINDEPLAGERVLIAEDSQDLADLFQVFVELAGGKAVLASNGREAIDFVMSQKFDLVIMDIRMPNVSGFDAAREISSVYPQLPILALSAQIYDIEEEELKRCGFTEFLCKPITQQDLVKKAVSLIASSRMPQHRPSEGQPPRYEA